MSLLGTVNKALGAIHDVAVGTVGPIAGKILNKGVNAAPGAINAGAGVIDKTIKGGAKAIGKIKDGTVAQGVGKAVRTVLTDESSYKQVGKGNFKRELSNKFLVLDGINSAVKRTGDAGAAIFEAISKEKLNNGMKNPIQLINKSKSNSIGIKFNKRGTVLVGGAMMISSLPGAGKQYVEGRRGMPAEQYSVTSAPRIPAYEQNGGATGDLVFALNNLRHGGMM